MTYCYKNLLIALLKALATENAKSQITMVILLKSIIFKSDRTVTSLSCIKAHNFELLLQKAFGSLYLKLLLKTIENQISKIFAKCKTFMLILETFSTRILPVNTFLSLQTTLHWQYHDNFVIHETFNSLLSKQHHY